jgi:hypothetical protein
MLCANAEGRLIWILRLLHIAQVLPTPVLLDLSGITVFIALQPKAEPVDLPGMPT